MALYEAFIISVVLSALFLTLTAVVYVMCNRTRRRGNYGRAETKTDSDQEDIPSVAFMHIPDGYLIPQQREWFI